MKTFKIETLGCRVNQYESEQIATLLRERGLTPTDDSRLADLRIVNSCSVTLQAASKSRQSVRRFTRLNVLQPQPESVAGGPQARAGTKLIVTGCWATSDRDEAERLPGVDAVITHHDDVAARLQSLLDRWQADRARDEPVCSTGGGGTVSLPMLDARQPSRQRAYLKVQDGCDAHCTYCIIPKLRPKLWSKPIDDAVEEAQRLVDSGHREIVLTGIFLGAFGQETALRRRQPARTESTPMANLVEAICTRVRGLARLRFSSLEPGDLTPSLIDVMKSHEQVLPHFHLPLQSGSARLLRRMNRQYTRDDYLTMIDNVRAAFDRPAITTDIIVGFPGEDEAAFAETLDVVDRAGFIHIHAFSYSPRQGTAAARWNNQFVHGPIVNERIKQLEARAIEHSLIFREQFLGRTVEVLVEHPRAGASARHGRSERYFDVRFDDESARAGDARRVRIESVTRDATLGSVIETSIGGAR